MDLPRNSFKHAIAQGKQQIGLWSTLCSNLSTEILADAGFDWILIDAEHSPNEVPDLMSQLQALAGGTATPIVRPAWNDTVLLKRILDIGVTSLLIPYVQNAEEAQRAVAATRYPTEGVRGVAGTTRASRFGRVKDYHARAASEICVLVQVETKSALTHLESIAAVPGIDGVFIGPADLAASMGHLGNPGHPEVRAAIADALKRLKAKGKPAGILLPNEADAQAAVADGFTFIAVGNDASLLVRAVDGLCKKFKP